MHRRDVLKLGAAAAAGGLTLSLLGPAAFGQSLTQLAAAQRFKIGDILLTAISDGYVEIEPALFIG